MPYYEWGSKLIGYENLNGGKIQKAKYRHYCSLTDLFQSADNTVTSVVTMSDIHSMAPEYLRQLVKGKYITKDTIVIMTGDMAGIGKTGAAGDADPYQLYTYVLSECRSLYLIQGNHDIYNSKVYELKNSDGTYCCVHNKVQITPLGIIGGVDGIVVPEDAVDITRHKYMEKDYLQIYNSVASQNPDIMLTHQPPSDDMIFAKVHLFGHAHNKQYYREYDGSKTALNMDSRIFIMT